jgi:enamine deaminase RidA (YjgF/YER057c/UK114 family)
MIDPDEQDEMRTLEAEFRQALQHRRAALEQLGETQQSLDELLARARRLLRSATVERRSLPDRNGDGAASVEPGPEP